LPLSPARGKAMLERKPFNKAASRHGAAAVLKQNPGKNASYCCARLNRLDRDLFHICPSNPGIGNVFFITDQAKGRTDLLHRVRLNQPMPCGNLLTYTRCGKHRIKEFVRHAREQ